MACRDRKRADAIGKMALIVLIQGFPKRSICKKNAVSVKGNKATYIKMRYVCILKKQPFYQTQTEMGEGK